MFNNLVNELGALNPDDRKYDVDVKVQILRPGGRIPGSAYQGDACHDIHFCPQDGQPLLLLPGHSAVLETGIAMEIPAGWEAQVRSRSGLAAKSQLFVVNSPGTVDSAYRGEIKVIVNRIRLMEDNGDTTYNFKHFTINPGDRIAQICFRPTYEPRYETVIQLSPTTRGVGGLGSSGVSG